MSEVVNMVELLVVMNCGTARYKTETFENKIAFIDAIDKVQAGHKKLIYFTDKMGRYIVISPANCVIECSDC